MPHTNAKEKQNTLVKETMIKREKQRVWPNKPRGSRGKEFLQALTRSTQPDLCIWENNPAWVTQKNSTLGAQVSISSTASEFSFERRPDTTIII